MIFEDQANGYDVLKQAAKNRIPNFRMRLCLAWRGL